MGVDNFVQICTDNAFNMRNTLDILKVCYPSLYFESCATHCFNFLLNDQGKEPWVKCLASHAKTIVPFIWTHHMPLAIYHQYEPTFSLSHLVETQLATNFFMVDRLVNVWETIEKTS
jgi:hypothetical protein